MTVEATSLASSDRTEKGTLSGATCTQASAKGQQKPTTLERHSRMETSIPRALSLLLSSWLRFPTRSDFPRGHCFGSLLAINRVTSLLPMRSIGVFLV